MAAAAVLRERLCGAMPLGFAERDDGNAQFLDEIVDFVPGAATGGLLLAGGDAALEDETAFDERRRANAEGVRLEHAIDERQIAWFRKEHCQKGRGVERYTPSLPYPRIASSSSSLSRRPSSAFGIDGHTRSRSNRRSRARRA